jgi:hypothetical protein
MKYAAGRAGFSGSIGIDWRQAIGAPEFAGLGISKEWS